MILRRGKFSSFCLHLFEFVNVLVWKLLEKSDINIEEITVELNLNEKVLCLGWKLWKLQKWISSVKVFCGKFFNDFSFRIKKL